ncbi:MAG: hypothetical protein AAAC47_11000, partial [Pararhizobium sp.]
NDASCPRAAPLPRHARDSWTGAASSWKFSGGRHAKKRARPQNTAVQHGTYSLLARFGTFSLDLRMSLRVGTATAAPLPASASGQGSRAVRMLVKLRQRKSRNTIDLSFSGTPRVPVME